MNQKMLTVHEAAQLLEVSPDTVRRWEKKGLLRAKRLNHNYRFFDADELHRLHAKLSGKGIPVEYKILKANRTDHKVIELFSGCGGMALGFENAGLRTELLVEIDRDCCETLRLNRPHWNIMEGDIHNFDFSRLKGEVDIVAGGFPCQAFSYAGHGRGFEDTRGTLFFEFARCVKEVQPKIALGENVRGLTRHDNGRTLKTMLNTLQELGYETGYRILKAQFHDVPQKRERLIIIGVRKDAGLEIFFPKEKDYTVSLREALKDCPKSDGQLYPEKKRKIMELVPPGGYWRDLPLDLQQEYMQSSFFLGGGKTGMARRMSWDEPSLTLTCAPAQKQTERCHPDETRPFNVREYARIQTFPDEWCFAGSTSSQYKQIGNAVPVNLGFHIGRVLIGMIEKQFNKKTMEIEKTDDLLDMQLALY